MCFGNYCKKAKSFLLEPTKAYKKEAKSSLGEAFKFLLLLNIPYSILFGLGIGLISWNPIAAAGAAVGAFIMMIIFPLIGGLILHIFAFLFGAKKGFEQTLKAVFYAETPVLLLGWIPFIGPIFNLWTLVLEIIGIKNLHKVSTGTAVLALLVPLIILGILAVLGMLVFLTLFMNSGMIPQNMFMGGFNPMNMGLAR